MTTAESSAGSRAWQAFRRWRRGRPFWGGLLAILAGLELFATTQSLEGLEIKIGMEGFQSILIPLMLVLAGILGWATPAQRHFYGVITVVVAVYSFVGLNFGGFFIGMLLGIIGGALIFAWSPAQPPASPEAETPDDESDDEGPTGRHAASDGSMDELLDGASAGSLRSASPPAVPQQRPVAPDEHDPELPRRSPRLLSVIILPVALVITGAVALQTQSPAAAEGCTAPRRTAEATTSPTARKVKTPSPTTAAPSPTQGGGIIGDILDALGGLLGGKKKASPSPSTAPKPTPTKPTTSPTKPTPGGSASPQNPCPSPTVNRAKRLQADAGQLDVALRPGQMTGSRVTMINLNFQGIVDLPTADGAVTVLKFTMNSSTTDDFKLRIHGGARDVLQSTAELTVKQNVVFYTNRFRGNLFGLIPVDYTPTAPPPPIPLPIVFFTNPDIQLVLVTTDVLTAKPKLTMKLVAV